MKHPFLALLAALCTVVSTSSEAESIATVRVPMCLQYPDRKVYVPCTGVIPVDKNTGDAMSWSDIFKGSQTDPIFTKEVSRRAHWSETSTPLGANQLYTTNIHDDGGTINGGTTSLTSFSCFVLTDQTGVLNIQGSDDNVTWLTFQTRQIAANVGLYLIQPLFTKYWRCQVANGTIPQTSLSVKTAFGM